ncbi:iron complex transport system ATP-binding protein [Marinomonas pollencensis]|uniref:Iron complex transport system ATP-binding protein n=2 Tax=Marinomonas pollencensis TaxID=491954 RepID=A0A3E0DQ18_9GAMM|nr:ABC transporter ATP-binding protein [Marinomonas pollencensis]REG84969.1 iron complex transport system ATP-binding protein [Marinomonas pollencensis]
MASIMQKNKQTLLQTDPLDTSLSANNLSLKHGKAHIIDNLDVALPAGKVTAIVGPNGCGKSTLLNGLSRVHMPSGGEVLLNGNNIHRVPSKEVARYLALLPQDTSAPDGISVAELIRFGRHPHQSLMQQWAMDDQQAIAYALAAADLNELKDRQLDTLSGGQRQRAWIAMSIAQETPLLLLDEPTSALDLGHQIEVFELIRHLSQEGKTIAMVVHDLPSACRYADHIIAMKGGKIITQGPPKDVMTKALVRELYGIECDLIEDPMTGSPILINIKRVKA